MACEPQIYLREDLAVVARSGCCVQRSSDLCAFYRPPKALAQERFNSAHKTILYTRTECDVYISCRFCNVCAYRYLYIK
uniref:Uncharacterized protein n=1 Tax=Anguilla anguilla TaxID=7936 RepID=A0A0E9WYY7_ANGAN